MVRHWTPKPVIICSIRSSPTGGNFFFAVVKSFEYKIAIAANFVQTVKNSNVNRMHSRSETVSAGFQSKPLEQHDSYPSRTEMVNPAAAEAALLRVASPKPNQSAPPPNVVNSQVRLNRQTHIDYCFSGLGNSALSVKTN